MPRSSVSLALVLAPALAVGACAREPAPPGHHAAPGTVTAFASREARSPSGAAGGTLEGEVVVLGTPPEREPIASASRAECGHDVEVLSEELVVQDGRLRDVLVRVLGGATLRTGGPTSPAVLDQRGCTFRPHVLGLVAGTPLEVRNSDPVAHNVHARPRKNVAPPNRTMAAGAPPLVLALPLPELGIGVRCDLHPWMGATVHVLEDEAFAVTGPDGTFRIEGLRPGDHVVEARHERLGTLRGEVRVEEGRASGVRFSFFLE